MNLNRTLIATALLLALVPPAPYLAAAEQAEEFSAELQKTLDSARIGTDTIRGTAMPFYEKFELWMERLRMFRRYDTDFWPEAIKDEISNLKMTPEELDRAYEVLATLQADTMKEANKPQADACASLANGNIFSGEEAKAIYERNETNKALVTTARTFSFVADVSKELGEATAIALQGRINEFGSRVIETRDAFENTPDSYYGEYLMNWCQIFAPAQKL